MYYIYKEVLFEKGCVPHLQIGVIWEGQSEQQPLRIATIVSATTHAIQITQYVGWSQRLQMPLINFTPRPTRATMYFGLLAMVKKVVLFTHEEPIELEDV